jgi:hypothetical protein
MFSDLPGHIHPCLFIFPILGIDQGCPGHFPWLYILRLKSLHQFDRVLLRGLSVRHFPTDRKAIFHIEISHCSEDDSQGLTWLPMKQYSTIIWWIIMRIKIMRGIGTLEAVWLVRRSRLDCEMEQSRRPIPLGTPALLMQSGNNAIRWIDVGPEGRIQTWGRSEKFKRDTWM